MFDFETPYLDMYRTGPMIRRYSKPLVLHQKTCPICDRKRVNLYYSVQMDKYMCKHCIDQLMKEKEKEDENR